MSYGKQLSYPCCAPMRKELLHSKMSCVPYTRGTPTLIVKLFQLSPLRDQCRYTRVVSPWEVSAVTWGRVPLSHEVHPLVLALHLLGVTPGIPGQRAVLMVTDPAPLWGYVVGGGVPDHGFTVPAQVVVGRDRVVGAPVKQSRPRTDSVLRPMHGERYCEIELEIIVRMDQGIILSSHLHRYLILEKSPHRVEK